MKTFFSSFILHLRTDSNLPLLFFVLLLVTPFVVSQSVVSEKKFKLVF